MTSYREAGVDIQKADAAKRSMRRILRTSDRRLLGSVGSFAALATGKFPGYKDPILVLKAEEPGSKQKLAFKKRDPTSICFDTIHHLINDIVVMGATPLYVLDTIICGKLEERVVTKLVKGFARACKAQGCLLVGGETSEQPGVIPAGTYILAASIVGIVERKYIINGRAIRKGDTVLALASNGLHTNGYSLVRKLSKKHPALLSPRIMKPHRCYYHALKGTLRNPALHGMAHITGGGIEGNLNRILPKNLDAAVDTSSIKILPVFKEIRTAGSIGDKEMLRTFNMGVGIALVSDPKSEKKIRTHLEKHGVHTYPIGKIIKGTGKVRFEGTLRW